jgi:hypothetical protein
MAEMWRGVSLSVFWSHTWNWQSSRKETTCTGFLYFLAGKGGRLQGFNNLTESEGETKIFALVCFTKVFVKTSSFFPQKIIAKSVKKLSFS